jgi:transcriptional regulator with XRE-family HTH domain
MFQAKACTDVDRYIAARLRDIRQRRGLTQETLGEALGITFQQIQKYETGRNRISASRLHAVAGVLQVPVTEFFPPTTSKPKPLPVLPPYVRALGGDH